MALSTATFGSLLTVVRSRNRWSSAAEVPVTTPVSEAMSRDLRQRGFKFVGPVICYALMQAIGMVNDHTLDCFRHADIRRMAG
jgi:DNA-3-methyladenine glycosylase I